MSVSGAAQKFTFRNHARKLLVKDQTPDQKEAWTRAKPKQNSIFSVTNLLELPLELLVFLLENHVPHADQLKLREVSSFLCLLLDTIVGFKVTLDNSDPPEKFDFISELAVRRLVIQNLTCDTGKSKHGLPIFSQLFLYPNFIQHVTVKGDIEAKLLNEIVRSCEALRSLELCPGSMVKSGKKGKNLERSVLPEVDLSPGENETPIPANPKYLRRCSSLKLILNPDTSDHTGQADLGCEAVLAVLNSVRSPVLKKMVVQGWISDRFSVPMLSLAAATFLENNPGVEAFFFGIIYEHFLDEDFGPLPISKEMEELNLVLKERLKNVADYVRIQKFGISTHSSDMKIWSEFVKRQSQLVHVSFTVDLAPGLFQSDTFRACRGTLKQFILRGKFHSSFDFQWVEDCVNLKEICLHNLELIDDSSVPQTEGHAAPLHCVNMASLPVGLESLVLFQTLARTDDVSSALRRLKLETLVLFKIGSNAGETGVNSECLKLICSCRTLESILLVRFVAPNPVEAAELVRILQTLNDGQIHKDVAVSESVEMIRLQENLAENEGPPPLVEVEADNQGSAGTASSVSPNEEVKPKIIEDLKGETATLEPEEPGKSDNKDLITLMVDSLPGASSEATESVYDKIEDLAAGPASKDNRTPVKSSSETTLSKPPLDPPTTPTTPDPLNFSKWLSQKKSLGSPENETNTTSVEPNLLDLVNVNANEILPDKEDICKGEEEASGAERDPLAPSMEAASVSVSEILNGNHEHEEEWEDLTTSESDSDFPLDDDEEDEDEDEEDGQGVFDLDLENLDLEVLGEMAAGQDGQDGNIQVVLNLQNEDDLQAMLGILNVGENNEGNGNPGNGGNLNNVQFGFILDGVIDVQSAETKRSRWAAQELEEGHLTYTLKISID